MSFFNGLTQKGKTRTYTWKNKSTEHKRIVRNLFTWFRDIIKISQRAMSVIKDNEKKDQKRNQLSSKFLQKRTLQSILTAFTCHPLIPTVASTEMVANSLFCIGQRFHKENDLYWHQRNARRTDLWLRQHGFLSGPENNAHGSVQGLNCKDGRTVIASLLKSLMTDILTYKPGCLESLMACLSAVQGRNNDGEMGTH